VIPLFVDQIKSGKALTVTNPEMTRFMMTLENAVELVLFAFEQGDQGDIFVQKAPACTLGTLTAALKELYNQNKEAETTKAASSQRKKTSPLKINDHVIMFIMGQPSGVGKYTREDHNPVTGQTVYTLSNFYTQMTGQLLVYLNGQLLKPNHD
jgi:hypothetical protein